MIVFLYLMQKQTAVFPVYFVLYLNTKYDLCPKFVLFWWRYLSYRYFYHHEPLPLPSNQINHFSTGLKSHDFIGRTHCQSKKRVTQRARPLRRPTRHKKAHLVFFLSFCCFCIFLSIETSQLTRFDLFIHNTWYFAIYLPPKLNSTCQQCFNVNRT